MIETSTRILDWIGAGLMIFVFLVLVYGLIYIHDIPYSIAEKRNHPHQDAILAAGWLSLFLLHVIWPFLWIWALLYKPGISSKTNRMMEKGISDTQEIEEADDEIAALKQKIIQLETRLDQQSSGTTPLATGNGQEA